MSLFRHIQKMVEKHQSALLQTFNKKKHAYLSKIQVHRNSFVWRNGFHYSPHPIEQHFMKFKWSFFFNYKERCLAVIEPNHVDLSFFWMGFFNVFFFSIEVFGYVIFVHCLLSRNSSFFSVWTESDVFENTGTLAIYFLLNPPKIRIPKPFWTGLEGFLREDYYG